MARYRRYRRRKPMSAGQRAALEHIEQGRRLSAELGGLDADVKAFLFSRPADELRLILDEYERKCGRSQRRYAEEAIPRWRSGATAMSGTVAERLFRILPAFMTLEQKLELARKLWEHTSPSSYKTFVVRPDIGPDELQGMRVQYLEQVVVPHEWPADMVRRFDWLSADVVQVKQELMNAIRHHEAAVLAAAIPTHVVPLINELHRSQEQCCVRARHEFAVGKHRVVVDFRSPTPVQNTQGCLVAVAMVSSVAGVWGFWLLC